MLVTHWLALVAGAFLLTVGWLYVPEQIYVSGGLATISWSVATLAAPGLQTLTESGARVAAGAPLLAFVTLAFAALSALATIGYRTGHYPPEPAQDDPVPAVND